MTEISVTIKYHKDHGAPWLVVRGEEASDVLGTLRAAFGSDIAHESLTLSEAVANASREAQSLYAVSSGLGGKVSSAKPLSIKSDDESQEAAVEESPAKPEAPEEQAADDPYAPIAEEFAEAESIDALKALWARHKSAYNASEKVRAAYAARGKALKNAS